MECCLLVYLGAIGVGSPSPLDTVPSVASIPHPDSLDRGSKLKVWGRHLWSWNVGFPKGGISPEE
jgi:hypothetical protein